MTKQTDPVLSVVVPIYNEGASLKLFHTSLVRVLSDCAKDDYEIIYCDDGSNDGCSELITDWATHNPSVKLVQFSRNFGKENALSAGIAHASGKAIIMLDGDNQHPVQLIPRFLDTWKSGAEVVVGIRESNTDEGWVKKLGSKFFYKLFNKLTDQKLLPGSTDFRLIDRSVQQAFLELNETNRITRGLIDWLGFRRDYVHFDAVARQAGNAGYSPRKLVQLATNSFVSLTLKPLYLFGYLGVFITIAAFLLGSAVLVEQLLLNDPWHWLFTGTSMLGILVLFLVGILLMAQGIVSLYISDLHSQSRQRPLYVISYKRSVGIAKKRND